MDQRPPGEPESPPEAAEPSEPPTAPAPMPWEHPPSQPESPRSTIITAEPVLTDQPGAPAPEVSWAPPPPIQGREVPGAPGFVFADTPRRFVAWVLDSIVIGIASAVLAGVLSAVFRIEVDRSSTLFYAVFSVIYVGLSLLYFVLSWTSSRRATPGMRVLQLQVGTAFDGRPLEIGPAVLRWALLGYPLSLSYLVPATVSLASLLEFVWVLALLISTVVSNTKQGLHDRAAHSAVVQPANAGGSALVTGCLVLVVVLIVFWLVSIVGLIFLGGQIEEILREVGESV
jgi:uncharacterized RDD family membrane protein YckC